MNDIKTKIINDLKQINYPGYNRDIVSFGIVKDIIIDGKKILFLLKITTDISEHKEKIKKDVTMLISDKYNFEFIEIQFSIVDKVSNEKLKKNIKNIVAVASCKGGVGKSTIAINLASKLSENYKVGLLDLDIYGPSLPTLIGEKKQPDFKDNKIIPIKKFNMELMSFGFINNENSPAIWRGPMVARMTQQFFDNVESSWMSRNFFTGGLMPYDGFYTDIRHDLVLKKIWRESGISYHHTLEAWLNNLDRNREKILPHLDACRMSISSRVFLQQYRFFLIFCSELFKFNNGNDWYVINYLFDKTGNETC